MFSCCNPLTIFTKYGQLLDGNYCISSDPVVVRKVGNIDGFTFNKLLIQIPENCVLTEQKELWETTATGVLWKVYMVETCVWWIWWRWYLVLCREGYCFYLLHRFFDFAFPYMHDKWGPILTAAVYPFCFFNSYHLFQKTLAFTTIFWSFSSGLCFGLLI